MTLDALRFAGEVIDPTGRSLGEARFWGSAERGPEGAPWRGWLRVSDLGATELARGHYRVRAAAGWEAAFEPLAPRPARVYEIDLLPIAGIGDAPWADASESAIPHQPTWDDTPPRTAAGRTHFPALAPLELVPREGLLPRDLPWPPMPEAEEADGG